MPRARSEQLVGLSREPARQSPPGLCGQVPRARKGREAGHLALGAATSHCRKLGHWPVGKKHEPSMIMGWMVGPQDTRQKPALRTQRVGLEL